MPRSNNDTRIVQMQFDNKSFERNIATSQKSLDKFKKALNFEETSKGLKEFLNNAKGLALETLSDNIQRLTDKFTGLGNAGEYVLSRIRRNMEDLALQAENFVKTMTLEQVKVGQDKYDALTKSVQTIVASGSATEEKAYGVMERVMEYTNQTSHSFETMVGQISSLTSIGIPLTQAEKMMEGFANASTKAGADASKAAIAMQVYAKAMGSYMTKQEFDTLNLTARVVTKEWREELLAAGVAAGDLEKDTKGVIRTAKKYGKQIIVTADNVENSFNKKWATRNTWAKFAEKYGFGETIEELKHPEEVMDSFGKQAYLTGQRALTFADALNAVKESVSSGWMRTFRLLFGDLTDAMNLWTGACNKVIDAIEGIAAARNAIIERWSVTGGRDALLSLIFGEMVDTEGHTMYEGAYGLIDMMTDIGNMISDGFWSMVQMFLPSGIYNESLGKWGQNTEYQFWVLGEMLKDFTINVKEAIANLKAFFSEKPAGSDKTRWDQIRDVVTMMFTTIGFLAKGVEGLLYFLGLMGDQLSPSAEKLGNLFSYLSEKITDGETEIVRSDGIKKFFTELAEDLKPFTDIINDLVSAFTELIVAIADSEALKEEGGNFFSTLRKIFKDGLGVAHDIFRPIADFIIDVMGILGDLFKDGFDEKNVESAKKRFSTAFDKLVESLSLVFRPLLEKIGTFFGMLWEEIKSRITRYFNDPRTLGYKILQPIKKVIEFLSPVWNLLKNLWENIKGLFFNKKTGSQPTLFDTLKVIFMSEGLTRLVNRLKSLAKDGGLYKLLLGALGVVALWQIIKAVRTIGGFFDDVGGNLKAGIMGTYEWFSEKIQGVAKGLMMLAASVALLGMMSPEAVVQGVIALGVIMLEFVGFMKLMDAINPATITKQMVLTGAMSAFAAAIAALVLALVPFALVGWEGFARMILGLTAVLGAIIGFMELMKVLSLSTFGLHFKGIVAFALAIGILMFSLVPFMMTNWDGMLRAVLGLAAVLLELIGFMELMKVLSLSTYGLKFAGIARFAIAIALLNLSLVPFMLTSWEGALRAVLGLAAVLLELIGFMELMKVLSLSTYGLGFKGIIRFALAVALLNLSLVPFMLTDWSGMLRAVVGLAAVLLEMIGFMELMKVLSLSTFGLKFAGILSFTLAIGILMLSLIPFMVTDWSGMLRAVLGLGLVLAELIGFMELMKVLSLSTFGLNFAGIIGFTAGIAILILAIKNFADMGWEGLAQSIIGLTVVFGELLGFLALLNLIPINPAAIGMVIAVCLSIGTMALLLSLAMNEVRNLKWEVVTAFTAGMAGVIIAMAGAIAALSAIPLGAGLKGVALLTAGVTAILGIIALLAPAIINSIGNTLASMGGKLELASSMLKNFADKMGAIDEGNISKAEGIFDQLKNLLMKLRSWGKYTGDFDNFSYSMFALGTGIEIFNNHIGGQTTSLDSNSTAALKFIQDLSGCAGDLSTISTMDMDSLIEKISGLGGAMYIFAKGMKETDGMEIGEMPDITGALAIINSLGKAFGNGEASFTIPEDMPDADAMSNFGASIAALAAGLVLFEEAGSGLGLGTKDALRVIEFFADIKERLNGLNFSKGLGAAIKIFDENKVDKNELTEFGTNIEQLGLAMSKFYESTTILDEATGEIKPIDFSNAVTTLDSIIELQNKLGWDFGPLIQFFAGRTKNFTDLGAELEALSTALFDFVTKLGGVDENGNPKFDHKLFDDAIKVTDEIVTYLKELAGKMGRVGGLWNIIVTAIAGRDYNFTDLKTQIQDLAKGIGSLGELKVDNKLITVDDTRGIFNAVDSIIDYLGKLSDKMGRTGGLYQAVSTFIFGHDYNFTDLKDQLIALSDGLKSLTEFKIEDIPTSEEMKNAFPTIDALMDYLKELKKKMGTTGGLYQRVSRFFTTGYDFDFVALKDQLVALGEGLNSLANVTVDADGKTLFNPDGTSAATEMMDTLITYMLTLESKLGMVGGVAQTLDRFIFGKGADFEYLGGQLGHLGAGLGQFQAGITANGDFDASKVAEALGALDHLVSLMQTFSVLQEKMDAISQSYGITHYDMKTFMINMWDALSFMTAGLGDNRDTVVKRLAMFIKEFDYELSELGGFDNTDAIDVLNKVSEAIGKLVIAGRNMQDENGVAVDFTLVGMNISNGIAKGIADSTAVVEAAARAVVRAAINAANAEADINSPSRVFMEIGSYMTQGLAIGVQKDGNLVENSMEDVTDDAINSMGGVLAVFADLMSQEIDANPTITPVLDLTEVTTGMEMLHQMFANDPYWKLNNPAANIMMPGVGENQNGTETHDYTDTIREVKGEVANMRNDLRSLSEAMGRMKLVMNTGEVVGAIGPEMDQYLGRAGFYYSRI